jgi:hypothetical protein
MAILDALVVGGAEYENVALEGAQDSAIQRWSDWPPIFQSSTWLRHSSLFIAVAKAVEREAKAEDAGKESEHGLCKPLLMSLLLRQFSIAMLYVLMMLYGSAV